MSDYIRNLVDGDNHPSPGGLNLLEIPLKFRLIARDGRTLFEGKDDEFYSYKECVEEAVRQNIDLSFIDFTNPFDGMEVLLSNKNNRDLNLFKFKRLSLANAHLDGGIFRNCFMEDMSFVNASLKSCDFSSDYTRHDLERKKIIGQMTEGRGVDFSGSDLTGAKFNKALLAQSTFSTMIDYMHEKKSFCILKDTNFSQCDLSHARFSFAKMDKTIFKVDQPTDFQSTLFEYIDFKNIAHLKPRLLKTAKIFSCKN